MGFCRVDRSVKYFEEGRAREVPLKLSVVVRERDWERREISFMCTKRLVSSISLEFWADFSRRRIKSSKDFTLVARNFRCCL